jgi:cytochrome b
MSVLADKPVGPAAKAPQALWDLPTRAFHWALAGLFLTAWISARQGWGEAHRISGYAILSLVLFRIYWGFRGGRASRFADFVQGPRAAFDYLGRFLARRAPAMAGHNPLGGWAVVVLLVLLLVQAVLGLVSVDAYGTEAGPLAHHVSFAFGRRLEAAHALIFRALEALVILHLAAIAAHRLWAGENLVAPMINGGASGPASSQARAAGTREAVLAMAVIATLVAVLVRFG